MNVHSHDYWQLYYVTEGDLVVETDGKIFCVNSGCMHIQPASVPHALSSETGYTQLGINFNPPQRFMDAFPHPLTLPLPDMLKTVQQIAALDTSDAFYIELLNAYCDLLLYTAASAINHHTVSPLKQRILDTIERDLGGNFSIGQMAEELFVSTAHLERACQRFFGMSALTLRNRKRFNRACALLMNRTLSVRDVSEQLGFSEVSNFSAFFRKHAGFSPSEYRKRFCE